MRDGLAGDRQAYAQLLQALTSLLRSRLSRRLNAPDTVDDLVQEVLIAVHKARHTWDASRPLLPWVMAIARYKWADWLRRHYAQGRQATVELESVLELAAPDVTFMEGFSESMKKELQHLNAKQQEILSLLHVEGFTAREAGARIGMSETAVKVAAHRAYKLLRKRMERA